MGLTTPGGAKGRRREPTSNESYFCVASVVFLRSEHPANARRTPDPGQARARGAGAQEAAGGGPRGGGHVARAWLFFRSLGELS